MKFQVACQRCGGTGKLHTVCKNCNGDGRVPKVESLDVRIPPGAQTGSRVRVAGRGNAGLHGGPAGDLYIVMKVEPHPFFERRGDDLFSVVPITVTEASLGAKVEVPTIDGRSQVRIPPGTNSGKKLRLREKGAPSVRQAGKRGDQIIEVQIIVPKPEDERVRNLLKELSKLDPEDPRREIFEKADGLRRTGKRMMVAKTRKKAKAGYMISAVAEIYKLHPQTLRLYERVGLLKPSRSQGNTRLYTDEDLERLEVILNLTRELGVNLAGIEIILNMRDKMSEMQSQMEAFTHFVRNEMARNFNASDQLKSRNAIIRTVPRQAIRVQK